MLPEQILRSSSMGPNLESLYCHLLRNSFLFLLKYNHKEPIKIFFLEV